MGKGTGVEAKVGVPFSCPYEGRKGVYVCMWQVAGWGGGGGVVVVMVWGHGDGELEGRQKQEEGGKE